MFCSQRIYRVIAIFLCGAISGCGGRSGGATAILPQSVSAVPIANSAPTSAAQVTKGNVVFAVKITPKVTIAGNRTKPAYVSVSTQSLTIRTDGANPVVVRVAPNSANCSPASGSPGSYICVASLVVSAGNHVFEITASDAAGNVLSTNSTGTVSVKATERTTISLVLRGAVRYVVLSLAATNPAIGKPATIALTPVLEDADNNLIVGPAPYEHPVTLTTSDSKNGSLSRTAVNSPNDAAGITVGYSGGNVSSIVFSASAEGVPAANVIAADLTPGYASQHLYILNARDCSESGAGHMIVNVFDTAKLSEPQNSIDTGTPCPRFPGEYSIAVDASGLLYTASYGPRVSVVDTAHGNVRLPTITGSAPDDYESVAVDTDGKLYVANGNPPFPNIRVFDTVHGNRALPTIEGNIMGYLGGMVIDAHGRLYLANNSPVEGGVIVFDTAHPGTESGIELQNMLSGAIAIDASGKLYVGMSVDGMFPGVVRVFDTEHGNAELPSITSGFTNPEGLAVDASGKLYVADVSEETGVSRVLVFDTLHGYLALPGITLTTAGVPPYAQPFLAIH